MIMGKVIYKILLAGIFVMISQFVFAQSGDVTRNDTIVTNLHSFSHNFYYDQNIVDRSYDYELINKKRKIEMWAREVDNMGAILPLAIVLVDVVLVIENEWNLWINIPCTAALSGAVGYSFYKWGQNIKKRADAIEVSPMISINSQFNTFGISITANF